MLTTLRSCSIVLSFLVPVAPALGGLPPAPGGVETFASGGIDYARVRAASVTPFDPAGHGNVLRPIGGGSWDFAISRTEVSQKVWVEFMGEFNAVPVPTGQPWTSRMESMLRGEFWVGPGMYATGVGPLGRLINRVTDEGATLPARFMGWYGAAAFCNWLHNDRQVSIEALTTGAYDLRQWNGADPDSWPGVTRQAGARYWIPSYDEWAVAAFYDPNRSGPNQPGWWPYLNRLERPPVPGAPGVGETSAGWEPEDPNFSVFLLPSAAYPQSQSPWGLLDTSGTYHEILEDQSPSSQDRRFAGSQAGPYSFPDLEVLIERLGFAGADSPNYGFTALRIATSVPSPSTMALFVVGIGTLFKRSRR